MVQRRDAFAHDAERHRVYTRVNEGAYKGLTDMLEETLKTIHRACDETR